MLLKTFRYLLFLKILSLSVGIILLVFLVLSEKYISNIAPTVFVIDLSHSMNIQDLSHQKEYISRLDGAKQIIKIYIENSYEDQEIGIMGSHGSWSYILPDTADYDIIEKRLETLHTNSISHTQTANHTLGIQDLLTHVRPHSHVIILTDGASGTESISSLDPTISISSILLGDIQELPVLDSQGDSISTNIITQKHARDDTFAHALKKYGGTHLTLNTIDKEKIQDLLGNTSSSYFAYDTIPRYLLLALVLIALGL